MMYTCIIEQRWEEGEDGTRLMKDLGMNVYLNIYAVSAMAPLMGIRFGYVLFVSLVIVMAAIRSVTDTTLQLSFFFYFLLVLISSSKLELLYRRNFLRKTRLQQQRIDAEMELNPFTFNNLFGWLKEGYRENDLSTPLLSASSDYAKQPDRPARSTSELIEKSDEKKKKSSLHQYIIPFSQLTKGRKIAGGAGGNVHIGEYASKGVAIKHLLNRNFKSDKEFIEELVI